MDFAMARAPTARITGRFVNTFDQPAGGSLMLMPSHHSLSAISVPLGARIFSNGMFEFPNVPPGGYVIQAYRDRKNPWTEGEFGATRVTVVDSDVEGVIVRTSTGSSIHGRVSFDATQGTRPPSAGWVGISPVPVDPDLSPPTNLAAANIGPDGNFMIEGINGPRRLEVLKTPPGWSLKEIRVGGIDMTDRVFPFATARESLSDDDRARSVPNASVIVFPADRSFWYPRSRFLHRAFTDPVGSFIVSGLPAGSYYVAAASDAPLDGEDAWQEPVYLESLISRASTILLGEGQRLSVNPRVGAP